MHDGSVGGGRKGIGREGYLAWIGARLVTVASSDGRTRDGVVVANINAAAAGKDIARFVESVADFKQAVKDGRADSPASRHARQTYKGYFDDFSGRKRGRLEREIEYVTRHGDIVKAIRDWRLKKSPPRSEIVKERLSTWAWSKTAFCVSFMKSNQVATGTLCTPLSVSSSSTQKRPIANVLLCCPKVKEFRLTFRWLSSALALR
ncbi:MAG TPA: hypothetical protein VII91_12335 [Bauldia sp.]